LRAAYRAIFLDGAGSLQDNARSVQNQWADMPEVCEMIAFILADAKRPVCPARKRGSDAGDES
jgi:acyl-[acyl carrier protein]--UDP-N-acetylglucosamine O-acyltransferase